MINKIILILTVLTLSAFNITKAQPSGGPYGPIDQTYTIPLVAANIYYVAPNGDENEPGNNLDKPTTIEHAFEQVVSGDYIILRGGVYRTGNLILNQKINMQPFKDEKPILKGSYVASNWRRLRENLWVTNWDHLFDSIPAGWWQRDREGMYTPLHKFNNDMVFIDGKFLQSAGWEGELDEESFFIDYDLGEVFIGSDPEGKLVEITAFDLAIERTTGTCHGKESDGKGPVIRGITFTQYAHRAIEIEGYNPEKVSAESEHGKDVVGTIIENCEISYCSRVAAYLRGDSLILRQCKISHTSTEGIFILSSNDVLIEKNIFAWNNIEQITGYYPAAVKIFNQCYRVRCNDNLIINHPYSNGIWYDVGNVDGVFTNNYLQNIGIQDRPYSRRSIWPGENAFFFEISLGAIVAGNVFVDCEHGATVLNSSNVEMYNNTFINSTVCIGRDSRSAADDHFGWHPASGPDVNEREGHVLVNNLFTATKDFHRPLVYIWQPADICQSVTRSPMKQVDFNKYVLERKNEKLPVMLWSPYKNSACQAEIYSLEEFQEINPGFDINGSLSFQFLNSVFKSPELGSYQLIDSGTAGKGTMHPDKVYDVLNLPKKKISVQGAYPGME